MRVGTLGYASDSGLGYLVKTFYDNRVVTYVMVVEHPRLPTHWEWYSDRLGGRALSTKISPFDLGLAKVFCERQQVMVFFETPFDWSLLHHCRAKRVKTVVVPMHECMPLLWPSAPDLILCTDLLNFKTFRPLAKEFKCRIEYLPVPVSEPWRLRTKAEVFVHNAGHGGMGGRNGTREVMEAMRHVKTPAKLILRSQHDIDRRLMAKNIDVRIGTFPKESLYDEGDVFLFPEKHCGLSLPLQEAYASGMCVMAGDRFPMNTWLPTEPLVPVRSKYRSQLRPDFRWVDRSSYDPKTIAAKVDDWYGRDISHLSLQGREWAEQNSWSVLKSKYLKLMESLL